MGIFQWLCPLYQYPIGSPDPSAHHHCSRGSKPQGTGARDSKHRDTAAESKLQDDLNTRETFRFLKW